MKQAQNARQQRGRPSSRQGGKSNRGSGNHRNEQKSRGNPKQLVDKYQNQARECLQAGDRMQAEYFFQFAEHYYRVLNENRNNNANQGANQNDRDGQQNNGRRQHSQNGENNSNDGSHGGRNQRRGRRGRPHDDRQNVQNGAAQPPNAEQPEQTNVADTNGASQAVPESEAPKPVLESDAKAESSADMSKTEGSSEPKPEAKEDKAPILELNGDAEKPVKRRAPRKRAAAEEKPVTEAALDPVVSDLS